MTAGPAPWLALTKVQSSLIRDAAAVAYPKEFCALLIGVEHAGADGTGTIARVTRIVLADNVDPSPERGFELDPKVLVRELRALREAERAGQERGERLLGHVHSHPDAPAVPSVRDLAQVVKPDQIWLILPVANGFVGSPRAFQAMADAAGQASFRPVGLMPLQD